MPSNYDKTQSLMQQEFLKYDQNEMISRFALDSDEKYLSFGFLGSECRVERASGAVECRDVITGEFAPAGFNAAMTVYDLLCHSRPGAAPSGSFMPLQSLSGLHGATQGPDSRSLFSRHAKKFDHKDDALRAALLRLGGISESKGDVSARIKVFCGLEVLFRFWDSDDEFDPEIQFLWDSNSLQYMHYETLWYACSLLIERILRLAGE